MQTVVMTQTTVEKKPSFVLSERSDFHMIDNLSIAVHAFVWCILTSLSVNEILLPRYVNWSTSFRGFPLKVEIASSCLKHINSVLFTFTLFGPSYAVKIWLKQVYL